MSFNLPDEMGGVTMSYIASIDIGTTTVKGVLIDEKGAFKGKCEVAQETLYKEDGRIEQDPEQWWNAFKKITAEWWTLGISAHDIAMIALSGQMQDCIPIDKDGNPTRHAILYSDVRAETEAQAIQSRIPKIQEVTGNHFDGSMPFPKIKWLFTHEPDNFKRTHSFLISSKDFIIHRLTGESVTDPTSGATTGMMRLKEREWFLDAVEGEGIDRRKLPQLLASDDIAGYVHAAGAQATGLVEGTPVLCGVGDAGATTMGAGVAGLGDRYAYLGTTGWMAISSDSVRKSRHGVFHLAHLPEQLFIKVAPLTNAGNAHRWAVSIFTDPTLPTEEAYAQFEQKMTQTSPGANGVLFLPYLNGERCPVHDPNATGSFVRLQSSTNRYDMSRAVLEGVACSIRQSFEYLSASVGKPLTLLGGGSRSRTWCQILADVCQTTIYVPEDAEYLPSLGAASSAFLRLGWVDSYEAFAKEIIARYPRTEFTPIPDNIKTYNAVYEDFVKLYPALKVFSK